MTNAQINVLQEALKHHFNANSESMPLDDTLNYAKFLVELKNELEKLRPDVEF